MSFLDAIGLISGALGIVQFGLDNFPTNPPPEGTTISIKAGLAANLTEAGGGINQAYCYDADNQYLGAADGGGIDEGGVFTTTCDQSAPDTQGDFVGVTFTDDAVCVAWITVNMHDGSPSGAWTGDVGSNCGEIWYTQTQTAGTNPDGSQYIPRCTWFDADHTTGDHSSMKFRTRAYGTSAQDTVNNNNQCGSTIYGVDNTPIDGAPAKKKRDTSVRPAWMTEQLIVSSIDQHSSKDLCDSETSYGPDFVDTAGNYCDMETKTLTPLCSAQDVAGCLTIDGTTLKKRTTIGKREVQLASKSYKTVTQW